MPVLHSLSLGCQDRYGLHLWGVLKQACTR